MQAHDIAQAETDKIIGILKDIGWSLDHFIKYERVNKHFHKTLEFSIERTTDLRSLVSIATSAILEVNGNIVDLMIHICDTYATIKMVLGFPTTIPCR